MPTSDISLDEARDILLSRVWGWRELFLDAFSDFLELDPGLVRVLAPATVAGIICDAALGRFISTKAIDDTGIQFGTYRGQRHFWVEGLLCLRIKKLNKNFLSSNYRTKQSEEWNGQSPLSGLSLGARLEFGYQVDATGYVLTGLFMLFRRGPIVEWLWQIHGAEVSTFGSQPMLTHTSNQRQFLYETHG